MTIPTIMPSTTAKAGSLLCHNPTASGNNSANTTYNMAPEAMKECVDMIGHRAVVEASGGIDEHNLEAAAAAGVDVISIGALTHSVKALDISLDVGEIK